MAHVRPHGGPAAQSGDARVQAHAATDAAQHRPPLRAADRDHAGRGGAGGGLSLGSFCGMSEVMESTALVVIRAELPTVLSADKDDILGNLQRELTGFDGDASTEKGRKEIASKAYKVSVAKKDLERLAATLKESAQRTLNGINAEVRVIKDRMDALRDQVRKPLDDYEARIAQFETDIKTIEGWADVSAEWTSDQIEARIAEL